MCLIVSSSLSPSSLWLGVDGYMCGVFYLYHLIPPLMMPWMHSIISIIFISVFPHLFTLIFYLFKEGPKHLKGSTFLADGRKIWGGEGGERRWHGMETLHGWTLWGRWWPSSSCLVMFYWKGSTFIISRRKNWSGRGVERKWCGMDTLHSSIRGEACDHGC